MNPIIRETVVTVCSNPRTPEALREGLAHYLATGDYRRVATEQNNTGTYSATYICPARAIETLPLAWRRIAHTILWMQQGTTTAACIAYLHTVKKILADAEKFPDGSLY
jgi:hypothetical protein